MKHTFILHSKDIKKGAKIAKDTKSNFYLHKNHIELKCNEVLNLAAIRNKYRLDINAVPKNFDFSKAELFLSDMDSTLINIECVDEIADFQNIKDKVQKITDLAMQGKLNFDQSLIKRVAMLKGLSEYVLDIVYNERLKINKGGEKLISFLKKRKLKLALVSGGFTFFTDKLKDKLKLDFCLANKLEIENNCLTGKVIGKIINADAKALFLKHLCNEHNIDIRTTIVAGDGANDLKMLQNAGLSISYHGNKILKDKVDIIIDYGGLDKIIDFFEIK